MLPHLAVGRLSAFSALGTELPVSELGRPHWLSCKGSRSGPAGESDARGGGGTEAFPVRGPSELPVLDPILRFLVFRGYKNGFSLSFTF